MMGFQDDTFHPYRPRPESNFVGICDFFLLRIRGNMEMKVNSPLQKSFYDFLQFASLLKNFKVSSKANLDLSATSSGFRPPKGWGMITIGNLGIRRICASILPRVANSSVQMLIVGVPCFSNSMASWIHHDMQEPQSPIARITKSQ